MGQPLIESPEVRGEEETALPMFFRPPQAEHPPVTGSPSARLPAPVQFVHCTPHVLLQCHCREYCPVPCTGWPCAAGAPSSGCQTRGGPLPSCQHGCKRLPTRRPLISKACCTFRRHRPVPDPCARGQTLPNVRG